MTKTWELSEDEIKDAVLEYVATREQAAKSSLSTFLINTEGPGQIKAMVRQEMPRDETSQ